jgi:hypothetical protein
MHEPRWADRLGRIEHIIEDLRGVLFQRTSDRRKAQKARKRREKRRRKKAVLAEGEQSDGSKEPADSFVSPEAGGSQPPIENWEPPIEESWNRIEGDSPPALSEPQHRDRDAKRLLRALKKVAYDKLRERKEGKEIEKVVPSRVYITLEDRLGVSHQAHRVGIREELQTSTKNLRKSLIRIFRLKNLVWELHRRDGNQWAKLPKLVQVLQAEADYRLIIIERKRKRPNAPGSSKRRHFERANQRKRKAADFCWRPPDEQVRARPDPRIEPSRPPGWKPLIVVPELVCLSEEGERKLADQRMRAWSQDQVEFEKREVALMIEKREKQAPKQSVESPAESDADKLSRLLREAELEDLANRKKAEEEIEKQTKFLQKVEAERERRSQLSTEERNRAFEKIDRTPVDKELEMDERFVKAMVNCEEIEQRNAESRRQKEEAERERIERAEIQRAQEEEELSQKVEAQKIAEERRRLELKEAIRVAEEQRAQRKIEMEKEKQERERIAKELASKAREERRLKMMEEERARRLAAREEEARSAEEKRKRKEWEHRPIMIELEVWGKITKWKSTANRFYSERDVQQSVRNWAEIRKWDNLYPTERHNPSGDFYSWRLC